MIFERYFARNVISREVSVPAVIVGRAWVIRASSRALVCGLLCHLVEAFFVLSKVFVFAIMVSAVLTTGAEGSFCRERFRYFAEFFLIFRLLGVIYRFLLTKDGYRLAIYCFCSSRYRWCVMIYRYKAKLA